MYSPVYIAISIRLYMHALFNEPCLPNRSPVNTIFHMSLTLTAIVQILKLQIKCASAPLYKYNGKIIVKSTRESNSLNYNQNSKNLSNKGMTIIWFNHKNGVTEQLVVSMGIRLDLSKQFICMEQNLSPRVNLQLAYDTNTASNCQKQKCVVLTCSWIISRCSFE